MLLSAFFSGSETGLMSLNRYRLKHLAEKNHGGARRAVDLLKRPDRLITLILLGNNFVNVLMTQLATYIGYRLYGDAGIAIAAGVLTLVLLLFAEVTPKTMAAANPEKIAFPAAYVYQWLSKILFPLVVIIDWLAKLVLKLLLFSDKKPDNDALTSDELRVAVKDTRGLIPDSHRDMLLSILDLEKVIVDDIMVPRSEIMGIDLEDSWHETLKQLTNLSYTRIPIYSGNIDNLVGVALMRKILPLLLNDEFNPDSLAELTQQSYFIPEGTPLTTQLINFRKNRQRMGFVVDGSTHIREINRNLNMQLPSDGPRTLNGLILEHMEFIPESGTSLKINDYPIEIMQVKNNMVKTARISLQQVSANTALKSRRADNG